MVERMKLLDSVFGSLGDPTRRDILQRVARKSLNIGEIARSYPVSFAAVAKHIQVLAQARLVTKTRQGKLQVISINAAPLHSAVRYLEQYRPQWEQRLDRLGAFLESTTEGRNRETD
jgi:DNA-binding transcriptional ArsR family regulator